MWKKAHKKDDKDERRNRTVADGTGKDCRRTARLALSFCLYAIGIREDAEDVVQEALLSVFRRLREKTRMDNVGLYVIRAVSNACTDYLRRKPLRMVNLNEAKEIPVSEGDRQIHEEFVRINKMLDSLPAEQAELVRLKCYDDLTFRQIAELQNIPEATAKSRYRYAIMHIQQMLKKGE